MQNLKHVLLLTYYWPPAGGAGVHRWVRFSSFFKENNWQMHVYSPSNAHYPIVDSGMVKQVSKDIISVQHPIFEPQQLLAKKAGFGKGSGLNTTKKRTWIQKSMIWLRGNIFIPDARVFWVRPSVKFLSNYLKEHPEITHIISTGPPHSVHLIALKLKQKFNLKWTADFRDPWTEIYYYKELLPGKWADKRQKKLEKKVLQQADLVLTVSKDCALGLERLGERSVNVVTNGFIFPEFDHKTIDLSKKFTIAHFGSIPASFNPKSLWIALSELLKCNEDLRQHLSIELYGNVDQAILQSIEDYGLNDFFSGVKRVDHHDSIALQRTRSVLLLTSSEDSKGILTSKVFEYFGAKRPILAIYQRESELDDALKNTASGVLVEHRELEETKTEILTYFNAFLANELYISPKNLDQYSSQKITKELCTLLSTLKD